MRPLERFAEKWLPWARGLFIPIALGFLGYSAYRAGGLLQPLIATISVWHLLLAWLCWTIAQWIGPLATTAFARLLGVSLSYRELSLISILRLPAKYLPGGIWQSVARAVAYSRHDISGATSITMLVAEHFLALGISTALGASLLLQVGDNRFEREIAVGTLTGALLLLIVTALWLLRIRKWSTGNLVLIVKAILATTLFWITAAAGFCAYWTAVSGLGDADILRVAACYLLSWAAGFAAIFAPQGLGVFEWVAAHLLRSTQPLSVCVTIVAGFRLVTIAGDLSAWGIGVVISRTRAFSHRADS